MSQHLTVSTLSPEQKLKQLSDWLNQEETVIKRGGIAKEAQIDKGTLSRLLTGKRGITPRKETVDKLISIAEKYGFTLTENVRSKPSARPNDRAEAS